MVALVEPTVEGQLEWNRKVVDYARAAADAKARSWEGPALNNMGVTLNEAGRHDEALAVFREALAAYERAGKPGPIRIAQWMIANTLRLLKRVDEALAMQLELERQFDAAGETDPYVFEELALLYDAKGDAAKAAHYRALHRPEQVMAADRYESIYRAFRWHVPARLQHRRGLLRALGARDAGRGGDPLRRR